MRQSSKPATPDRFWSSSARRPGFSGSCEDMELKANLAKEPLAALDVFKRLLGTGPVFR